MDRSLAMLLAMGALPFLLVVVHGVLARALRLVGLDLGAQLMAIVLVLLLNAALAVLAVAGGAVSWPYDVAYVFLTANALWFVYFQVFVNLSLTSLHARLLLHGLWHGSVEPRALAREYDSEVMLSARLGRLQKLRQVRIEDGTMSLHWPYLLWLSYPLYWWRRLIGLEGEQLNLANGRDP
jgi:hypothetical protein